MSKHVKLRKIGNSVGVVLTRDMLDSLNAGEGDEIAIEETPNGLRLIKRDSEFEEHMELVEKALARFPNTLRALAK
ncbi:MAG: AbrB/MazE/SpoVT family DNA-binding domain-containing protein [Pseudomonadota bacterium]